MQCEWDLFLGVCCGVRRDILSREFWLKEPAGVGSMVSHPFQDEAMKRMGHPGILR